MSIEDVYNAEIKKISKRGMAITLDHWYKIEKYLKPGMRTLECGSGISTKLFEAFGCRHTALEDVADYGKLWGTSVQICSLVGNPPWYDWAPPEDIVSDPYGLILIDGPIGKIGRAGFKRVASELISENTVLFLDDTHRKAERELSRWLRKRFALSVNRVNTQKGKKTCDILVRI